MLLSNFSVISPSINAPTYGADTAAKWAPLSLGDDVAKRVFSEFEVFENYLADFVKTTNDAKFNRLLMAELGAFVKQVIARQLEVAGNAAIDQLSDIETMFDVESTNTLPQSIKESAYSDSVAIKVNEFFQDFISKNMRTLSKITDDLDIWTAASDGGKYCLSENDSWAGKGRQKVENAVKSYAYQSSIDQEYPSVPASFIALFDTTIFGSAKEGMLFTQQTIYLKELIADRLVFDVESIKNIHVDDDNLIVDGTKFCFIHSEIKRRLRLVVSAFDEYINQPANRLKRYIAMKKPPYVNF